MLCYIMPRGRDLFVGLTVFLCDSWNFSLGGNWTDEMLGFGVRVEDKKIVVFLWLLKNLMGWYDSQSLHRRLATHIGHVQHAPGCHYLRRARAYLPSCRTPPPFIWYRIVLVENRGTCVNAHVCEQLADSCYMLKLFGTPNFKSHSVTVIALGHTKSVWLL